MTTDKAPQPYIVAQPVTATIRQAYEECQNQIDNAPGVRGVELDPVTLPSGQVAVMRCTKSKKGVLTVSIRFTDAKEVAKAL